MINRSWLRHSLAPWVILVMALLIGVAGMNVPPDAHEVYVLRTAQEMRERGDWIVPVYQGELRLEKPPLSYWLTGLTAWLSGAGDDVQPWHGRVPSVLGGLLLVGCTMLMGRRLFDEASANLAGLVAATSLGFVTFTHSARPEMLYAGCCAVVMMGLVMPRKGWVVMCVTSVGFALAMLAKGPHVPGMIVGGFAIWAVMNSEHRVRTLLRGVMWLVIGGAAVALAAGWWWWLMKHRLGEEQLANSALGGEGYQLQWSRFLSVYYPVQMVKLMATWAMLIPAGVALLMHRYGRGARSAHLIGWWLLTALAAFWGAGHRRDYYLLPYVGVMALLLAAGTWRFVRIWYRQHWLKIGGAWYAAGLAGVLLVGGMGGYFWSSQRFASMDFARLVAERTPGDRLLVGLGTHADLPGYVADRIIPYCENVEQLLTMVREKDAAKVSVVMPERFMDALADWSPVKLGQVVDEDTGDAMVLVELAVPGVPGVPGSITP